MKVTEELQHSGAAAIAQPDFWKQQLAEHDPEFLFVQTTPAGFQPCTRHFDTSPALGQTLATLSKGNDAALFTVLASALHLVLKRYGQEDPIIDIPRLATQDSIALNNIPLAVKAPETMTVRGFLNHINGELKKAYLHDAVPFSGDGFFKTNVCIRHASLHVAPAEEDAYDLCLVFDGQALQVQFNEQAFDSGFITDFAAYYFNVLTQFAQTDRLLADIDMLDDNEKDALLRLGRGPQMDYDRNKPLHRLVEQQAAIRPGHPAIIFTGQATTYGELDAKANQLAQYLLERTGGEKQHIAVMMDRSAYLVISILAILKAGCAYVPIDPSVPRERLAFVLQDAGVFMLLTGSKYIFEVGQHAGEVFAVDIQLDGLPVQAGTLPAVSGAHTAYIIYTSGSTGAPKGVTIRHESILNTILWRNAYYGFSSADKFLQIPSIAFDSSVEDVFCALTSGATLVIPEEERRKDVVYLQELIATHGVTHFLVTPSLYQVLLDGPQQLASLRAVTVAGEPTRKELVDRHFAMAGHAMLVNEYGPTEHSVCTTVQQLQPGAAVTIGKPIANVTACILSADRRLLPVGVAGELYIGGPGLSAGYRNLPELTAEKFVQWSPGNEAGIANTASTILLYRTGDFCRWLPDGCIEFIGRKDEQVKINGIRIELGEIETVIRQHEGVQECKVLYRAAHNNLEAVIVPNKHKEPFLHRLARLSRDKKGLLQHCRLLPNGMLVHHKNAAETELTYEEIFVQDLYLQHGIVLPDNAVVFDIGSNIGMFTLHTALHYPAAKIYAFEPLAPIFESLSLNVQLYQANAEAHNIGFAETEMETEFFYYYNNTASSGLHANVEEDKSTGRMVLRNSKKYSTLNDAQIDELLDEGVKYNKQQCKLDTLSNFLGRKNITHVDLVKLDVEKSELRVLKGIRQEDWKKIRQIVAEVHDMDDNIRAMEQLLADNGFTFVRDQPVYLRDTSIYYIYAKQKDISMQAAARAALPAFNSAGYFTGVNEYAETLRKACTAVLPAQMVPASFLFVPALPLTPNGKLDTKALLQWIAEESSTQQSTDMPATPLEKLLAETWTKVIGKEKIGLHDNFFQIGGDSIKAIQIAARMHRAGYKIEVKDIFENLTIARLATVSVPVTAVADQSAVEGPIRLTPIQAQFFTTGMTDPHHFNQAVMLQAAEGFDAAMVKAVFAKLQEHHDALRMVYTRSDDGWVQYNNGIGHPVSLVEYAVDSAADITAKAEELQRSIDLAQGPLVKLAIFHAPGADRLLIVIHHMVVDGVSWRILLEDIGTLISQYRNREELMLPLKTDSFKKWSDSLHDYAQSDTLRAEAGWWKQQLAATSGRLPIDYREPQAADEYCYYQYDSHSFALDAAETELLTGKANFPYNTQINDILLTALGLALHDTFGLQRPLVDLEGHGRENIAAGINTGRTVGWFTAVYPVLLDAGSSADLAGAIVRVKETLRAVPQNGIGYGILKYIAGEAGLGNHAEISFNYLGQFDQDVSNSGFAAAAESTGTSFSLSSRTQYELNITGMVAGKKLSMNILYNRRHFSADKMDAFGNAYRQWLRSIVDFCCNRQQRELTSSDLSVKGISKANIDKISALFGKKPASA